VDELAVTPDWPPAVLAAEAERARLREELQAAVGRLELLRTLRAEEPTNRFRWGDKETDELPLLQHKLLSVLCRDGKLRPPVPVEAAMATVTPTTIGINGGAK
jgi:hypothetical protein